MHLRYSATSPFARKVLVFAHETGVAGRITCGVANVWDDPDDIAKDNPLGRVPVLLTPDGPLPDSLLCCDYLDRLHDGPRLIPESGGLRWRELGWHALANGIMEAAVMIVVERIRRPAGLRYAAQIDRQNAKISNALAAFAADLPEPEPFRIGALTLACALAYLDLRLAERDWRTDFPALTAFQREVEQRPSLLATRPPVAA